MRSHVAFIQEDSCIGCTKCIVVCPTDAIVGAAHQAHTVVSALCIACDLCLPPCPVNCIELVPVERDEAAQKIFARESKSRIQARLKRLEKEGDLLREREARLMGTTADEKKAAIAAALERAKAKKDEKK